MIFIKPFAKPISVYGGEVGPVGVLANSNKSVFLNAAQEPMATKVRPVRQVVNLGRWFIVRHGETEWNAQGRIQGHTDVGLSDRGIKQAQLTSQRLDKQKINAAYSSDLLRSADTARHILGQREVPLNTTPELREYHKGVFEGLTTEETNERYPELFAASQIKDLDFAPPGGESTRETSARMASFIADMKERHSDDNLLIVGHGGTLRAAFVALMELPLEANWRFVMANCSLSVVDIYSDNAVLRLYNDTSHLDGLGSGI